MGRDVSTPCRLLLAWRCGHSHEIDGEGELDVQSDGARSPGSRRARVIFPLLVERPGWRSEQGARPGWLRSLTA